MLCGNKRSSPTDTKHSRCTFLEGAESCLSGMFNYKQEAVTSSKRGQDWSEDVKPNKQSQQAAKEETDVNRAQTAAL